MRICRTEGVSVLSDGEVFVMFVTAKGGSIARNISEMHKIM